MMFDSLVTGTVVTPGDVITDGWVAIDGGRISAIGTGLRPAARRLHDGQGAWILPGGIDAQTHAGSYWGLDGIRPTSRAAVAGGVTTMVDMPFDTPAPLTTLALLQAKRDAIERDAVCDIALYGTVAPGQDTSAMAPLAAAGVCAFKISVCESHPTRFPRIPSDQQLEILRQAAVLGLPVGLHNEDQEIVRASTARVRSEGLGRNPLLSHDACRPEAAELAATALFTELAGLVTAHAHIVHVSTPRGFDLLARQRHAGHHATGEICVHYLIFDPQECGEAQGARLKVNPPLRPGVREALWTRVAAGEVTCISSDHSTMSLENKAAGSFFDAGPGMPGLETMIPAFFTGAETRGLDAPRLVAAHFSEKPAKLFGLWPRKGGITVGADADLLLLEPGSFVHDSRGAQDQVGWSPYDGMRFGVRVAGTFVRGQLVWNGHEVLAEPGSGRFVPRRPS
jgi:allantoinase